jgi:hypothetical protein
MATTTISPVITDAGKSAAISANGAGLQLQITHVCLGTGKYTPATTATAMLAKTEKAAIGAGQAANGQMRVSVLFPGLSIPYDATEVGFYAGDPDAGGTLFAVHSIVSGVLVQRSGDDYVATFSLALSQIPGASVTVVIDSSSNLAMLAALHSHEMNSADPHVAAGYAKKSGVQDQSYTSSSTTGTGAAYLLAVTPTVDALKQFSRFHCRFHASSTSDTPTLAVSGLTARALKVYDSTGAKVAPTAGSISAGMHADVVDDGTDYVMITPLPSRSGTTIKASSISCSPAFTAGGVGTASSPMVIPAASSVSGSTGVQVARITVTGLRPGEFVLIGDESEGSNGARFSVSSRIANGMGVLVFDVTFGDAPASTAGSAHSMTLRINNLVVTHSRGITAAVTTNAPSITAPTSGATGVAVRPVFSSSAYSTTGGSDTHHSSDWQIASDSAFASIVLQVSADAANKTTWTPSADLSFLATFYARVRHRGAISGPSAWGSTTQFTTRAAPTVNAPSFTAPASTGVSTVATFSTTAFSVNGGTDTHVSTDWQVASDANFNSIVLQSASDSTNKVTWSPATALSNSTTYYARARHRGTALGASNWSATLTFTTAAAAALNTPSITSPANNAVGISQYAQISASAFSVSGGTDTHASSDWQIASDSGFLTVLAQSLTDTTNKTTWVPSGLQAGAVCYVRVRYRGTGLGVTPYSSGIKFTTLAVSAPVIASPASAATGVALRPAVQASLFSSTGSDTHHSSDWQIATDSAFSNVVQSSLTDQTNKTTWTPSVDLAGAAQFFVRVRYRGATGVLSSYSTAVSFTTQSIAVPVVNTPTITSPSSGASGVKGPFTTSAFGTMNGSDTHGSTDWLIAADSAFSSILARSDADAQNKLSWTPSGLTSGTSYYVRARHNGSSIGSSAWSAGVAFTWISTAAPSINSPANNATGTASGATISASAFASSGSDTHSSSDWQIASGADFSTIVRQSLSDAANKTTWTPGGLAASTAFYARVRYRGAAGGLSAYSATVKFTTTSAAGVTWSYKAIASPALRGAAYGASKWVFVGFGGGGWTGEGSIWSTTDFTTFTQQADRFSHNMGMLWSVIWTGTKFVSVGYDIDGADQTGKIMTSADGVTWAATSTTGAPKDVAWNGSTLVAVGYDASYLPYAWVSSNGGATWTRSSVPSSVAGGLLCVEWHPGLGLFVAGGMGTSREFGPSSAIATSPDGLNWTAATVPSNMGTVLKIGTNGSLLVAVGHTSAGTETAGAICTSSDGANWTSKPFSGGVLESVVHSGGQWVACGKTAAGTLPAGGIWTSSDSGATWTSRSIDAGALYGMAFANSLFVTVGHTTAGSATNGAIYTSSAV